MAEDQRETEVKFCVFNLLQLEVSFRELDTHLFAPRTLEVNLRFDTSSGDLTREGRVLRLRRDDLARLTYKDKSQNIEGALSRREIEFVVNNFDSAKQFIEALGYEVVFIYEKYRTTVEYKGAHIMLDELPYGNFIEIEGELEMLRPIAEELHLDWGKAIPASYHALFECLYQTRGLTFRDLTFNNFKGIKVSPMDMMIEYADHEAIM
jgi:adenylate cyclase, class 2